MRVQASTNPVNLASVHLRTRHDTWSRGSRDEDGGRKGSRSSSGNQLQLFNLTVGIAFPTVMFWGGRGFGVVLSVC